MASKSAQRKLTAILSADAAGYSRLMGDDEESTIETITAYRKVFTSQIRKYRGRVVDAKGDAILAEFASVVEAVNSAVEIQRELAEKNAGLLNDRRMDFRIGVNLGDVVVKDDVIYGDGVNVAARLESLAQPGGICISRPVYDQVRQKLGLDYEYLGEQQVKNIEEPVWAYSVIAVPGEVSSQIGKEAGHAKRRKPKLIFAAIAVAVLIGGAVGYTFIPGALVETAGIDVVPLYVKPSIAVLPFVNLDGAADLDEFSDGITDDIITNLSKLANLTVILWKPATTHKNRPPDGRWRVPGRNVRFRLEGGIRREGNLVRVNARLTDTMNGESIWAEKYDRDLSNSFDVQDDLAQRIVVELDVNLVSGEDARLQKGTTISPRAWEAYLYGVSADQHSTKTENQRARGYFRQAIEIEPKYARALARLGWTHANDAKFGWAGVPRKSLEKALEFANKSLAIDKRESSATRLVAEYKLMIGEHEEAIALSKQSRSAEPDSAVASGVLGFHLLMGGRSAEAIPYFNRSIELSRIPHPWVLAYLGEAYRQTIQLEQAVLALRQAISLSPDYVDSHIWLAATYAELDMVDKARGQAREVRRIAPDFSVEALRPFLLKYKNPAEIEKLRDSLLRAGLD